MNFNNYSGGYHQGIHGNPITYVPMNVQSTSHGNLLQRSHNTTPYIWHEQLHFTNQNKMSLISLEKRIDYHLSRIMKGHRLINFKNAIENHTSEQRICECIIEVLTSSLNLITRKKEIVIQAKTLVDELKNDNLYSMVNFDYYRKISRLKDFATNLEQIVWALNSNKEHIKYVIKVFCVPEQFQRIEFSSNPNSIICLRNSITETVTNCSEAISTCRLVREQIKRIITESFVTIGNNSLEQANQTTIRKF